MAEWNHASVWGAIDALAARHGLSPSGLARKAGLDATAFNPSKRHGNDNRPRWPSTESISKVLTATGETLDTFVGLAQRKEKAASRDSGKISSRHFKLGGMPPSDAKAGSAVGGSFRPVPILGLARAGVGGFFDDGGFPQGQGWDEIAFPGFGDDDAYALQVAGDSMLPLYRDGDIIIVSPSARVRRGDRVVVKTTGGEVMAKILRKQSDTELELASLNPEHAGRVVPSHEIAWMARILWASQ
jgi:phage repressor protein C with HTH and peptisase S24 domain